MYPTLRTALIRDGITSERHTKPMLADHEALKAFWFAKRGWRDPHKFRLLPPDHGRKMELWAVLPISVFWSPRTMLCCDLPPPTPPEKEGASLLKLATEPRRF